MSRWRSVKAKQLLAALLRIEWTVAWQNGSHRRLRRPEWANYTFAFHDGDEVGPGLLEVRVHHAVPFGSAILLDHRLPHGRIQIETRPYKAGYQKSFAFEVMRTELDC